MWRTGLFALWHVGSSRTRAQTRVPCIGRRILNHCATREVLVKGHFLKVCEGLGKPQGTVKDLQVRSQEAWRREGSRGILEGAVDRSCDLQMWPEGDPEMTLQGGMISCPHSPAAFKSHHWPNNQTLRAGGQSQDTEQGGERNRRKSGSFQHSSGQGSWTDRS